MGLYIFLLLVLMPIIEIAVLIEIGSIIGTLQTVLLIVATAVIGTFMLRRQGLNVLSRTRRSLNSGEMPVTEVFEGVCLLAAGALLLTPGFVTDIVGFLLLIPAMRLLLGRSILERLLARGQLHQMNMVPGGGFTGAGLYQITIRMFWKATSGKCLTGSHLSDQLQGSGFLCRLSFHGSHGP